MNQIVKTTCGFADTIVTRTTESGDKAQATVRFTKLASWQRDAAAATSIGRFIEDCGAGSIVGRGIIGARGAKIGLHFDEHR